MVNAIFFLREKKLRDSRIVKIFRLSCGVVSAGAAAAAPSTNTVSVSATLFLLLLCFSVFRQRTGAAREVASLLITRPCFEFLELSFFDRHKKNEYIVTQNNMASQTTLFDFFKKKPATSASEQLTENDSGDATNAEAEASQDQLAQDTAASMEIQAVDSGPGELPYIDC